MIYSLAVINIQSAYLHSTYMTLSLITQQSCYCHLFPSTKLAAYFVWQMSDWAWSLHLHQLEQILALLPLLIHCLGGISWATLEESKAQGTRPKTTSPQVPPTSDTTRFDYHVSPLRILPRPNHNWVSLYATHLGSSLPPYLVTSGSTVIKNIQHTHQLLIYYNHKFWSMSKFNPCSHH